MTQTLRTDHFPRRDHTLLMNGDTPHMTGGVNIFIAKKRGEEAPTTVIHNHGQPPQWLNHSLEVGLN